MKTTLKRLLMGSSLLLLLAVAVYAVTLRTTTGSVASATASTLSFSTPCSTLMVVNNRNTTATPIYLKLNDSTGTPSTSATSYDFVLDQYEELILRREELRLFPVTSVGVFTSATTPTLRIVGW